MRFLWALLLLKSYDTENNMAGTCHCDEKTFRKWTSWFFILELSDRSGEVVSTKIQLTDDIYNRLSLILSLFCFNYLFIYFLSSSNKIIWENRYVDDIGNDCLASVDGTDFALAWGASDKRLSCYKFYGKPGLRYEVALCLCTGDIVWTSGPHTPGTVNDLQIFRFGLKYQLGYGERIEADDGYIGECSTYCKCPNGPDHLKDRELMNRLHRSRHETVNQRFKMFGCMKKYFRHDVKKHGQCFECVVLLTQLSINEGPGLFHIEYDDLLDDFTANLIFG